ncbi:PTS fructose transporter subunit IIB [Vibrio diazotrophicus]|uniref:PTS fructose transporter subunit IIB n=1 Tax=Vibrio diazotrophicus TaxID=685 RepID=UPI000C9E173A|nr:PTS fructose transporter subunit IIB [Vibrio diazotrophicus]PNH93696.1 PTS fructose transporter subunit IIB [Vibrio diazotrophicus]
MKIVAVTACPTGIAHTYMAADVLVKAASKYNLKIKVETQGAMGIENFLSSQEISQADKILIVSDIEIAQGERFKNYQIIKASIEDVLRNPDRVLHLHC